MNEKQRRISVAAIVVAALAVIAGVVWFIFSPDARDLMRWFKCVIDDTEPATVPIILITIFALILGVMNSLWVRLFRKVPSPLPAVALDKKARKAERDRRSDEVKRQITFDAVLAGITLALYLMVIVVTESLGSLTQKVALMLALLPGAVGLCHHVFAVGRHFVRRQTTIEAYKEFRQRYDRARRGDTEAASPLDELAQDDPQDYTPPLPQTFFASLLISAVFLVPASMSKHPYFLWPATDAATAPALSAPASSARRCCVETGATVPPPSRPQTVMNFNNVSPPAKVPDNNQPLDPKTRRAKDLIAMVNGLFFAGVGAYVWTLYLLVTRINTAALTSRFLMNCAVRAAMGIAIGAAVAVMGPDMFGGSATGPALLFVIGLLPQWALTTFRNKAKEWFGVKEDGCETLPLCLVDGLNDGLIDLLNELGVSDIEHLANSDPGELTLQTLFPLSRIVDWIDQAVLIQEVRGDIVTFRKMGIACATDMMRLHGEYIGTIKLARLAVPPPKPAPVVGEAVNATAPPAATVAAPGYDPKAEAAKVYGALGSATSRSEEALHSIGRKLYDNYLVTFLWNLWNMPGSIWTGWVAEVAEWMPAIFNAATALASSDYVLMPEPSWDGRIGVVTPQGTSDTLSESFIKEFPKKLSEELGKIGFVLEPRADGLVRDEKWWSDVLSRAEWWRDIVQPIFPIVRPRARKR